jgi:hypothetical protein
LNSNLTKSMTHHNQTKKQTTWLHGRANQFGRPGLAAIVADAMTDDEGGG